MKNWLWEVSISNSASNSCHIWNLCLWWQVHEKELLLQDLLRESVLGPEGRRRVGPACSRRIYRIFMAQNGNLKTDDVEQGADHFDDSD